jgi:hypothetical protein
MILKPNLKVLTVTFKEEEVQQKFDSYELLSVKCGMKDVRSNVRW